MGHSENSETQDKDFLDTVFDKSVGGFAIVYVVGLLIVIFLLLLIG